MALEDLIAELAKRKKRIKRAAAGAGAGAVGGAFAAPVVNVLLLYLCVIICSIFSDVHDGLLNPFDFLGFFTTNFPWFVPVYCILGFAGGGSLGAFCSVIAVDEMTRSVDDSISEKNKVSSYARVGLVLDDEGDSLGNESPMDEDWAEKLAAKHGFSSFLCFSGRHKITPTQEAVKVEVEVELEEKLEGEIEGVITIDPGAYGQSPSL